MDDQFDVLGQLIDSLDNYASGLQMRLPPEMHVEALRSALPELVQEFKDIFTVLAGENPWE